MLIIIPNNSIPRQGGSKYVFEPPTLTEDFWGPFFQKFNGFWKKIRKINGFQCLHDEKKPAAGENLGTPFLRARGASKIFRGPPKKFDDDVVYA